MAALQAVQQGNAGVGILQYMELTNRIHALRSRILGMGDGGIEPPPGGGGGGVAR